MTVGLLEAITSAIGDELTLLAGHRSTRLTSPFLPERGVASGVNNATSADGIVVTLSSSDFGAAAAGQRLRLLSGSLVGQSALILSVDAPNQITLDGVGVGQAFTDVSWEVVIDADTTMNVEVALGWPAAGEVFVDGVRYSYSSRTDLTLDGITHERRERSRGQIVCVAGNLFNEGEQIEIDDGYGHLYTLEIDKDGLVQAGNVPVQITNGHSADDVRDALLSVINGLDLRIEAFPVTPTGALELIHEEEGTRGNLAITHTVADAGFELIGMLGGALVAPGAKQRHEVLAEVLDYTRDYSSADVYRRAFLLQYAEGDDLTALGRNLGVERPSTLADDDVFRRLVEVMAYGYRGTRYIIEQILDTVLPPGSWEIFEDATSTYALDPLTGQSEFPTGPSRNRNTVFLRRDDANREDPHGKTFLDGGERRPMTSTTEVTLGQPPLRLASLRLAPDPLPVRVVSQGVDAVSNDNGATITAGIGDFTEPDVQIGDVFEILTGPHAGRRGTIDAIPSTDQITIGAVEGTPNYRIGANFSEVAWRVIRPVSNFRRYRPTDETYLEYDGDPGTAIWDAVAGGGATELANTSLQNLTPANGGRFLRIETLNPGETFYYQHLTRVATRSQASMSLIARVSGTPDIGATSGLQWFFQLCDGARTLTVGVIGTGVAGRYNVGFVDPATGAFIGAPTAQNDFAGQWLRLRLEKTGGLPNTQRVRLLLNGNVVEELDYLNAGFPATTDTEIRFGILDDAIQTCGFDIKSIDWHVASSTDYNNTYVDGGETVAPRDLVDTGVNGFFDPGDVGRRVRIYDFDMSNADGGNARGEWEIETVVDPDTVTLVGLQRRRARTIGSAYPRLLVIEGDVEAFVWPDNLGHQLVLESGPNAGTYSIARFIDPETFDDVTAPYTHAAEILAGITDGASVPFVLKTSMVEVTVDFPDPADDTEVDWHLLPAFPTGSASPYEIVDTSTVAGATVTLRQPVPFSGGFLPLLETEYTTVLSAQVQETRDRNSLVSPGNHAIYPFYLFDHWGWIRDIVEIVTAAGVIPDFDSMTRDDAGLHIQ